MGNLIKQNEVELRCFNVFKKNLSQENFFGFSKKEIDFIRLLIEKVKKNEKDSEFPDFIFSDNSGFIEHFSITSSLENRKGAKQFLESKKFEKTNLNAFKKILHQNEIKKDITYHKSRSFEEHSIENIRKSIKKNWSNHIKSLQTYNKSKKNGLFMMEYIDFHLHTLEKSTNEQDIIFEHYRISSDKEILNWLYENKNEVKILVLVQSNSVEIINLENIEVLLKNQNTSIFSPVKGYESHGFQPL